MFNRYGHAVYRARRLVLVVWCGVLLVSLPFAPRADSVLKGGGFANGVSEADQATSLMVRDLGFFPSNLTVIFTSKTLQATSPQFRRSMQMALVSAGRLPYVARIDTYYHQPAAQQGQRLISVDGHSALAVLQYRVSFDKVQALVPQVRASIRSSTLQVIVAGDGAVFEDMETISGQDLQTVEKYTLPIALILLALVFGTVVAAGVPVITGLFSVTPTLALIFAIGHVTDLSVFCLNVTTMIGLGVGIDYALFVVSRFREEVHHQRTVEDAVATAVETAGRSVLFSGFTVMVGLSALLLFHSSALRSIGLGGSLVVCVSVLAALTLLPALLGMLGTRIDAIPILPWKRTGEGHFWRALAARVMVHPWPIIAGVLIIVALIAAPFRSLQLNVPDATILPTSAPSRVGFDILNQQFLQQQNNPVLVVVHSPRNLLSPVAMGALYDYVHALSHDPGVDSSQTKSLLTVLPKATRSQYTQIEEYLRYPQVEAVVREYVGNNSTIISLQPKPGQTSGALDQLVRRVRAQPLGADLVRYVGGWQAGVMDYLANLYAQFPICIVFVVVVTYLILLILLRSVILPLKAVLMNALSLFGAYGAVVWIFQEGHLSSVLNFSPTGYVDEITPIIMFCVMFGLSMDYEVFLLSRMREQYLATGNNTASVAGGLERTGRIITSAALILVVVAGSFSLTNIVLIKAVGLGLATAILLDATLIRCLLVPATMRVLGHWNWWLPWRGAAWHRALASWRASSGLSHPGIANSTRSQPDDN